MKRPDKIGKAAIAAVVAAAKPHGKSIAELAAVLEEAYPGAIARATEARTKARFESKFVGPVPDYAKRYVAKYWPGLTRLTWRRSGVTLRGTCATWSGEIRVIERIGTDEQKMRILVLHEIAHRVGIGHDERFAAEFKRLLVGEKLYRAALQSGLSGQSKLRRVKKAATGPR